MSPTPAPVTYAPPLLWAAARALISTIFALFGEPSAIAARHTYRKAERTLLLSWLRAGEALMRHLLLIEAAHYARPNTRPLLRSPRKRVRRLMTFEADKPEAWRVSFRVLDRRLPAGTSGRAGNRQQAETQCRLEAGGPRKRLSREERWCVKHRPRPKFYSAWPLAERAEAMLRAFNNPEPYARRLAARLYARPHRAAVTRHPPNLPQLIHDFPVLAEAVETARRRFESG